MHAGALDRRITLQRYSITYDADNQPIAAWTDLGKRWASKEDVSDGEQVRAAQVGASVTTRFVLRLDSLTKTLTSADRIIYGGKEYSISGIKETDGRLEGIEITAAASTDNLVTP